MPEKPKKTYIKSSLVAKPTEELRKTIEEELKLPDTEQASARLKELLNDDNND